MIQLHSQVILAYQKSKHDMYSKKILIAFITLYCSSTLSACSSSEQVAAPAPLINFNKSISLKQEIANRSDLKKGTQLEGSKTPGKWIYSSDKTVGCRVKKWKQNYISSNTYAVESYIDVEVTNINSKKPVNMVYELLVKTKEGAVDRGLFNAFKDKQANLTSFIPPIKKGGTKVAQVHIDFLSNWSKVDVVSCRVAKDNETAKTLNPEMEGYKGP
jgi:hypothetical protein